MTDRMCMAGDSQLGTGPLTREDAYAEVGKAYVSAVVTAVGTRHALRVHEGVLKSYDVVTDTVTIAGDPEFVCGRAYVRRCG